MRLTELIAMSKKEGIKICTMCKTEKDIQEFYHPQRSYCIKCERKSARERMKRYNATTRGRAMQALNDSRKAVRKIEKETGRKIKNDLDFLDVVIVLGYSECSYCGKDVPEDERTLDHITPMRQGGDNIFSNVTMACRSCNSSKGDYPALSYLHKKQDKYGIQQLVDRKARRERISYDDAYMILFKDVVNYFEAKKNKNDEGGGAR